MAHEEELKQAVALARAGDKQGAVAILKTVINADRNNEQAWMYMTACVISDRDKEFCLKQIVRINPKNEKALSALAKLQETSLESVILSKPEPTPPPVQREEPVQLADPDKVIIPQSDPIAQETPRQKRKPIATKLTWIILAIIGGSLLICCFATIIVPALSNTVQKSKSSPTAQIAIQPTKSEMTATPIESTETPTATLTATATNTLTATMTNTSTITYTPTITDTPMPPRSLTRTAQAMTQEVINQGLTATQEALSVAKTATKIAKAATATTIAKYKEVSWKELATYPDKHIGDFVIVRGSIFNIIDDTDFQIFFAGTYEPAYISMTEKYSDLYEDDNVVVYGVVLGKACGTNAMGGEVCQVKIFGMFFGK